jgi:purine-binding chemotaxis protein CheW
VALMALGSKYVVFRLGKEDYGVPIDQVISIEHMQEPTFIPRMPKHIRGVLDIRQTVMPIADLRVYLLEDDVRDTEENRIIVVNVNDQSMGLVVDEAKDVIDLGQENIQDLHIKGAASESVLGIGKKDGRLIILLNLAKLLDELDPERIMQEIQEALERDGDADQGEAMEHEGSSEEQDVTPKQEAASEEDAREQVDATDQVEAPEQKEARELEAEGKGIEA